jgi:zinc protease
MRHILFGATLLFLFAQCTPKIAEVVNVPTPPKPPVLPAPPVVVDFRATPPAPTAAPKIQIGNYEKFTLENGLQVILVENHKLPKVSFQLTLDLDPFLEKEASGYSSIAGQLLNKGTTTRKKTAIDEEIDFIGANFSTNSSGLYASSLKKHIDKLLIVMNDVLLNPTFPKEEFDKIKKQTISGLASGKDDPNTIFTNIRSVVNFGKDHPYGELTTEKTVEKITLDQCKKYYNTYFKPNVAYLVVVGDITKAEAEPLMKKYFGTWKRGDVPKTTLTTPKTPEAARVVFVNKDAAVQTVMGIGYAVPNFKPGDADVIKSSVASTILGGYFGSRLNKNLREGKAYTYGVGSLLSNDKVVGNFAARASVRNAVTDSAMTQVLYEMNQLRNVKVSDEEMKKVKSVMSGEFARNLEDPQTVAGFALNTARYGLPNDYYATYLEKLNAVTADDVMAMSQKYITPERANIIFVGNKDEVADKLKVFAKNGKVDFFDTDGNEIKPSLAPAVVLTPEKVIEKYINAIGGAEKLKAVKDMTQVFTASIQGMSMEMTRIQKIPNKNLVSMSMSGNVVQKQVCDGTSASVSQMGQSKKMEGKDLARALEKGAFFRELYLKDKGLKLTSKGTETIDGTTFNKIELETAQGEKEIAYFDATTGLKMKEVATTEQGTVIVTYADYKETNGIKQPSKMTMSGAMPIPITFENKSIKINSGVEDAVFKVE